MRPPRLRPGRRRDARVRPLELRDFSWGTLHTRLQVGAEIDLLKLEKPLSNYLVTFTIKHDQKEIKCIGLSYTTDRGDPTRPESHVQLLEVGPNGNLTSRYYAYGSINFELASTLYDKEKKTTEDEERFYFNPYATTNPTPIAPAFLFMHRGGTRFANVNIRLHPFNDCPMQINPYGKIQKGFAAQPNVHAFSLLPFDGVIRSPKN